MGILLDILGFAAGSFLLIAVHELGHFLGGWSAGIPAKDMRIRLFRFPQHVELRVGERWVGPFDFAPYVAELWRRLRTTPRVYLYTAGGLLTETAFSAGAVLILDYGRWSNLAFVIAFLSCCLFVGSVAVLDILLAWRRGHACGDVSGMWAMAKLPTMTIIVVLIAARVWMLRRAML